MLVSFEPRPPLWNDECILKIEANPFNVTAAYTKVNGCLFLTCCSSVITPKWKHGKKKNQGVRRKCQVSSAFSFPKVHSLSYSFKVLYTQHVYFFQVSSKIPALNSNSSFPSSMKQTLKNVNFSEDSTQDYKKLNYTRTTSFIKNLTSQRKRVSPFVVEVQSFFLPSSKCVTQDIIQYPKC